MSPKYTAGKQVQQIVQKNGIALCYHAIPRMGTNKNGRSLKLCLCFFSCATRINQIHS